MHQRFCSGRGMVLAALGLLFGAGPLLAQAGSIAGTVRHQFTGDGLPGVRVTVVGTSFAATSGADGRYQIANVPAGSHEVRAIAVGFKSLTFGGVQVAAGLPASLNIELQPAVVSLEEVVVTGVVGETQRAKLAFTVDVLRADVLPVPQVNAASQIAGKVAGAVVMSGSGRPGSEPTILLRGPKSINASGRSQEPLYVVDGVILGSALVDLDGLDIEKVEVVKGAAAASLYGSRAANGVVQITTRRGAGLRAEEVHFTARSEFGGNQLPGRFDLSMHHQFKMNAEGTKFIQTNGTECDWLDCTTFVLAGQKMTGVGADTLPSTWNTYQSQEWPGPTYDQVKRFFQPGNFMQQYLAASGRSGSTNFHASYSNLREEGVMPGQEGFRRNNFRVNVDQSLGGTFDVGASAFYSWNKQDNFGESQGNPLFNLTRMPAGVDLMQLSQCRTTPCPARDEPRILPSGQQDPNDVLVQPDPFNNESPNPLYTMLNADNWALRGRFLGSANLRFRPFSWVSLDGNVSYDRLDYKTQSYIFKGYKTTVPLASTNEGNLSRYHSITQALNASVNLTLSRTFGDLATRTQFRYLGEWDEWEYTSAGGNTFAVGDVPVLPALDPTTISAGSGLQPVRADGFFGITNLEFKERYILDGLVRNDGSSLFGPDERRQWYYRLAGAWRVSQDVALPGVDEFKLRYAYGTAGGRPNFAAQYETFSVSGGQISPVTLGNTALKPELSKEQEGGVDLLLLGRAGLTVNYARTVTEDQILEVPLPAYYGYTTQWRNAGTLESNTWEATLDFQLAQTRNFSWTTKVLFDRTRQEITALNVPEFTYGVGGQGMGGVFKARKGEALGTFYGTRYATSCADLLGKLDCSEFAINDDGLLVWVGPDGSLGSPRWGTTGPTYGFFGRNQVLDWGGPIIAWGVDALSGDTTSYLPVGKTMPDFNMAFSTTIRWRGLSLYGLVDWTEGVDVYNQPLQWAIFKWYGGVMDQADVPDAQQKPVGYYDRLYGLAGLTPVNYWVQDGSFGKLREVSLRYRFDRDQLAGISFLRAFDGLAVSLIGRNLITWSGYNGYDPEVGRGGGQTGSAALARVDGFNYPNFRTFTAALEVNF